MIIATPFLHLIINDSLKLFLQTNFSGRGSQCNRAIMIVTDGSPETYQEIFEKYNAPNYEVMNTARHACVTLDCLNLFTSLSTHRAEIYNFSRRPIILLLTYLHAVSSFLVGLCWPVWLEKV